MSFSSDPLDLGHGHIATWTSWAPDRELNPQYAHLPDVERYGLLIKHSTPDGSPCMGSVVFASETAEAISPGKATWDVESWVPLTLSPSVLCSCGDHGWIRDGRWVLA
jgi:hypothetical protein